jgi:hypothetical protein
MIKKIFKFLGIFILSILLIIIILIGKYQYDQNQKVDDFFNKVDSVEIVSYPSRTNWKENDRLKTSELHLIVEKRSFKEKYIKDRILLSEPQKNKIIDRFKDIDLKIATQASCYEPRHLIVCFDKNNKVYGYIELCIECGTYDSSKNMEGILNFSMEKGAEFETLFKEFGIKYFTDNN